MVSEVSYRFIVRAKKCPMVYDPRTKVNTHMYIVHILAASYWFDTFV